MQCRTAITLLAVAMSFPTQAQGEIFVHSGFMKGESYLNLSEVRRSAYAMGLVDGFLFAPGYGAPSNKVDWLYSCISGMTDTQITAIIDKHIRDNPVQWQQPVHMLAHNALNAACRPNHPRPNN